MADFIRENLWSLVPVLLMVLMAAAHFLLKESNYRHNLRNEKPGGEGKLIGDQHGKVGDDYRFGVRKARGVACEAIAVHNARLLKGMPSDLTTVIRDAQTVLAPILFGAMGTDPYAIGRILRRENVPYEKVGKDDLDRDGVYIISFWNGRTVFDGLHTVCFQKGEKGYLSLNQGKTALTRTPPQEYAERFICAYYLGRSERELEVQIPTPRPKDHALDMVN